MVLLFVDLRIPHHHGHLGSRPRALNFSREALFHHRVFSTTPRHVDTRASPTPKRTFVSCFQKSLRLPRPSSRLAAVPSTAPPNRFAHLLLGPVIDGLCRSAPEPICPCSLCNPLLSCAEVPRSGRRGLSKTPSGTCNFRPRLVCARDGGPCSFSSSVSSS